MLKTILQLYHKWLHKYASESYE